MDDWKLGNI
ncbi:uncharacterized protein FRV6_05533 [Fusarium oxysporum]|uniref:Uncharacterized protein n=1 Tax=Fusarium oxysporum TaxID=5507 RepID=A0A2H3TE80_FUSOX|nr:uncharacterized protein FRV6_05533 [Fusarium oxysporum]